MMQMSVGFPALEQNNKVKLQVISTIPILSSVQRNKSSESTGNLENLKPSALSTSVTESLFNGMI